MDKDKINELKDAQFNTRRRLILEVQAIEILTPQEEGVELNEGYDYKVDGAIPELADSLAKLAVEMDKDPELGEKAGGAFLNLIQQYYDMTKTKC